MEYKFLNQIDHPIDLKKYKVSDLDKIAKELRYKTIDAVSKTGGHLGAGLGVIELTTEAVLKKSKQLAYLALLADPVVDNVFVAEKLLDNMIETQKNYLGYLN